MVGKKPFITETSSYNKLDIWIESRLIRIADRSELGRKAGGGLGSGIQIQRVLPKVQVWFGVRGDVRQGQAVLNPLQQASGQLRKWKTGTRLWAAALQKRFVFDGEPEGDCCVVSWGANPIWGWINRGIACETGSLSSLVRSQLETTVSAAVALRQMGTKWEFGAEQELGDTPKCAWEKKLKGQVTGTEKWGQDKTTVFKYTEGKEGRVYGG